MNTFFKLTERKIKNKLLKILKNKKKKLKPLFFLSPFNTIMNRYTPQPQQTQQNREQSPSQGFPPNYTEVQKGHHEVLSKQKQGRDMLKQELMQKQMIAQKDNDQNNKKIISALF